MLVVTTLAPPTAGERVARTNRQRMLVVSTLALPKGRREGRKDEQTKNARCHNSSPTTYSGREGRKDEQTRMLVLTTLAPPNGRREGRKDEETKNGRCHNSSPT